MCYGDSEYRESRSASKSDTTADVRKDLKIQIKAAKDVVKGKAKELRDYTKVVTSLEKKLANV